MGKFILCDVSDLECADRLEETDSMAALKNNFEGEKCCLEVGKKLGIRTN